MLARDDVLAGEYIIDALVGKGGMGCVYRAHRCQRPHEVVAIKELPVQLRLSSGQFVHQGASSQMKLMKRVDHAGIAKLLDAFRCADAAYMVFEFVEGRSLQSIVATSGALPEKQAFGWALQLCDILGYLHTLTPPVVYRDMKPSNVLLDKSGALKLVDLGIAREFKSESDQQKDTVAFGTQGYAPPEQYGCAQTDARADIYALGCTLWHLLSGFPPPMEFPLPSILSVNHQVSESCAAIIQRCTQLDRAKRYQSCRELAHDIQCLLEGCADGAGIGAGGVGGARAVADAAAGDADVTCECDAAADVAAGAEAARFPRKGSLGENDTGKKGPAARLARAFRRLLKPWPHEGNFQGKVNADINLQASTEQADAQKAQQENAPKAFDLCTDLHSGIYSEQGEFAYNNSYSSDLDDTSRNASSAAEKGDVAGALAGVAGSVPGAATSADGKVAGAAKADIARFCFSQAPRLILDDLPTVLLTSSLEAQRRATGELPFLSGAYADGFFFTIVQSEICVHDDSADTAQK